MTRIAMMAAALAMVTLACGGSTTPGGGAGGPAGVDRAKQVSAATEADKNALCDWFAPMVGGYGTTPACTGYLLEAPPDKPACLTDFPNCAVTIGQFEDCVVAIVAAQAVCTQAALDAVIVRADCMAVGAAGCFGGP